jgi:hypothetical protein
MRAGEHWERQHVSAISFTFVQWERHLDQSPEARTLCTFPHLASQGQSKDSRPELRAVRAGQVKLTAGDSFTRKELAIPLYSSIENQKISVI